MVNSIARKSHPVTHGPRPKIRPAIQKKEREMDGIAGGTPFPDRKPILILIHMEAHFSLRVGMLYMMLYMFLTSSSTQGGGGNFRDRTPIGG